MTQPTQTRLVPAFDAVPRRSRTGWTAKRQRDFIAALAASGCVTAAAAQTGLSKSSVYQLRAAPGAEGFAAAWDAALDRGVSVLKALAFDRAINGVEVPIFHQGKQVGERRWYDNRLLASLLRTYDRDGGAARRAAAAPPETKAEAAARTVAEVIEQDCAAAKQQYGMAQLLRQWLANDELGGRIAYMEQAASNMVLSGVVRKEDLAAIREKFGTARDYDARAAAAAAAGLDWVPSGFGRPGEIEAIARTATPRGAA